MANHIGETGSFREIIHTRDGEAGIVRTYRVIENANDRHMLRVEYTDAHAESGAEFLGSHGWVHVDLHIFPYGD